MKTSMTGYHPLWPSMFGRRNPLIQLQSAIEKLWSFSKDMEPINWLDPRVENCMATSLKAGNQKIVLTRL